jgi:hypothetical protein
MYVIAYCYEFDLLGFSKSPIKAFSWYLESVANGFEAGILEIARFYLVGSEDGSVQANSEAHEFYIKKIPDDRLVKAAEVRQLVQKLVSHGKFQNIHPQAKL